MRRGARRALLGLVLGVVAATALALVSAMRMRAPLEEGRENLAAAQSALLEEDLDEAEVLEEGDDELIDDELIDDDLDEEEEEEEDEDVIDPDDVEAGLDVILKDRLVAVDEDEDEDEETPEVDERGDASIKVLPKRPGEFVCESCFLLKHPSQLADAERMLCRDCV